MPRDRSNRIEVDLKLLQDKNVEKLQEFGRQFDKSIDKLATMLGSYSEQVAGATQTVERAGKLGADASRSEDVKITGPGYRMGGQSTGGFSGGFVNSGGVRFGGGEPSIASPLPPPPGPSNYEEDFARVSKRIGEHIPVGFRQTLGYAAEGQIKIPGLSQETARHWNDILFQSQALKANAMLAYHHLQNFYGGIQASTMLGQQLGRSREGGLFGTGLLSSAWKTGILESLKTGIESKFGFSPNYSPAQAKEARQALQSFGYSGDTSDYLASILKDLQIHQGVDAQAAMAILDPLMRFGGDENMGQLLSVLRQIPDAAKAAHMNLSEFTQQLISTSQQVAQGTGMTVGGTARALSAFTTTTGLSPSRAAGLFENPQNLILASGMSGQSITSLMEGKNRMAPRMEFGLRMFQSFTGGYSADQLAEMRKKDWAKYQQIMNGAWLAYSNNQQIFGGFSPRELINMQVRNNGHLLQHTAIAEQIGNANSTDRINQMLRGWGGAAGAHMSADFEKYVADHPGKTIAAYREAASQLIARSENEAQRRTARQITQIDMTPDTKKFFKILTGTDVSNRNAQPSFEREAMSLPSNFGYRR